MGQYSHDLVKRQKAPRANRDGVAAGLSLTTNAVDNAALLNMNMSALLEEDDLEGCLDP